MTDMPLKSNKASSIQEGWSSPKKVDTDRTDRSVSLGVFFEFGSVD